MSEPKTKRQYHSPRRQEQAESTRRNILDAARRLFASRGYAATTLSSIAAEAGVSVPTVTSIFGTKAGLLDALIKLVVRGDASSTPIGERAQWQEMLAEPDPRRQLELQAAATRNIHERSADVYEIVRGAATADAEIAAMMQQRGTLRLQDTRTVAESLAARGVLAPGLTTEEATDLLWALEAAEMYRLLVVERGWQPRVYERWLASALIQLLLEPDQATGLEA